MSFNIPPVCIFHTGDLFNLWEAGEAGIHAPSHDSSHWEENRMPFVWQALPAQRSFEQAHKNNPRRQENLQEGQEEKDIKEARHATYRNERRNTNDSSTTNADHPGIFQPSLN